MENPKTTGTCSKCTKDVRLCELHCYNGTCEECFVHGYVHQSEHASPSEIQHLNAREQDMMDQFRKHAAEKKLKEPKSGTPIRLDGRSVQHLPTKYRRSRRYPHVSSTDERGD